MIVVTPKKALPRGITTMMLVLCVVVVWAGVVEAELTQNSTVIQHSGSESDAHLPPVIPLANAVTTADGIAETMTLLNEEIPPGTYQRLSWSATEHFEGVPVDSPVLVVNGRLAGPTICLTAAVHVGIQTAKTPAIESEGNDPLAHDSGSDVYVDGVSE